MAAESGAGLKPSPTSSSYTGIGGPKSPPAVRNGSTSDGVAISPRRFASDLLSSVLLLCASWLSLPHAMLVPPATRKAIDSCVSELQACPGDALSVAFWGTHWTALQPHSLTGWFGLGAVVSLSLSLACGLSIALLTFLAVAAYCVACLAVFGTVLVVVGAVAACSSLLVAAIVAASIGLTMASTHLSLRVLGALMKHARSSS